MADHEIGSETLVKNVKITRGENAEVDFEIDATEDDFIHDELGNKIRFGDIYKRKKSIIIFVRHFLCFCAKDYVEDLRLVSEESLQKADVQLVVIGCAPWESIKRFRYDTGYKYELYCDPERVIYKKLGYAEHNTIGYIKESKHIKSGLMTGILKSTWRAMQARDWQGNPKQQGGSFVVKAGGEIIFSHIDKAGSDHVAINTLLKSAGVQEVSFPKDGRVIHL
ncbi:peroxiredoxin-like 2C [Lineus longissimus]|uniref:peroxiredoxin-like 2C n=1 Tax=Lineus longissimus TaxID=88925 RepID=UPI002B4ED98C